MGKGLQNIGGGGGQPRPTPGGSPPMGGGSSGFWDSIIEKQADKRFGNMREALISLSNQLSTLNQNFATQNHNMRLHYEEMQRLNGNLEEFNRQIARIKFE